MSAAVGFNGRTVPYALSTVTDRWARAVEGNAYSREPEATPATVRSVRTPEEHCADIALTSEHGYERQQRAGEHSAQCPAVCCDVLLKWLLKGELPRGGVDCGSTLVSGGYSKLSHVLS